MEVEGGSDNTDCPYIRIRAIHPGSVADKCGILRVGDELVQIDRQLVVGATHREATEAIGLIDKPTTLAVQRRQDLNLLDRLKIKTD